MFTNIFYIHTHTHTYTERERGEKGGEEKKIDHDVNDTKTMATL